MKTAKNTWTLGLTLVAVFLGILATAHAQQVTGQWRTPGGTKYFQRYSPLSQINKANVANLQVSWTAPSLSAELTSKFADLNVRANRLGTPIMVDGVLYVSDGLGFVEALDPGTGKAKWIQKPLPFSAKEAAGTTTRSVEYWQSGADKRIISIRGQFLYALDPNTGEQIKTFGDGGKVFLRWPTNAAVNYHNSSGATVVNDVVVVGGYGGSIDAGGYGDGGIHREAEPENVRGYDVRTGHLLWTFHIIPDEGQPGHETWGDDSWRFMGDMGAWGPMSADEELGIVYVPLTAPTNSYFGGHRPGDNKYSDSLVALNAKTGKLIWAYQLVHHDLWDYDTATPPVLASVNIKGKPVKVVMQANKPGMLYVFDRVTGKPVWPIEERPVPQSTVPGEHTSPTQPFSVQFPPISPLGVTTDDLVDFTPAMRQEAEEIVSHYVMGPAFTPPSLVDPATGGKRGSLVLPGVFGSGNWNTSAFDPETSMYYAVAKKEANVYGLYKPVEPDATLPFAILDQKSYSDPFPAVPKTGLPKQVTLKNGIPILKPPYGTISAYNISKGERMWIAPSGDDVKVRNNAALSGVKLPDLLGGQGRGAPLVTKTLVFLADTDSGDPRLRAYEKSTGQVVGDIKLPAGAAGAPMSYEYHGAQYVLVPVSGSWVAFALKH